MPSNDSTPIPPPRRNRPRPSAPPLIESDSAPLARSESSEISASRLTSRRSALGNIFAPSVASSSWRPTPPPRCNRPPPLASQNRYRPETPPPPYESLDFEEPPPYESLSFSEPPPPYTESDISEPQPPYTSDVISVSTEVIANVPEVSTDTVPEAAEAITPLPVSHDTPLPAPSFNYVSTHSQRRKMKFKPQ